MSLVWLVAAGDFAVLLTNSFCISFQSQHLRGEAAVCPQRPSCTLLYFDSLNSSRRAFMTCLSVRRFVYAALLAALQASNVRVCFDKPHTDREIPRRDFS